VSPWVEIPKSEILNMSIFNIMLAGLISWWT
jgi:hypothetical protein